LSVDVHSFSCSFLIYLYYPIRIDSKWDSKGEAGGKRGNRRPKRRIVGGLLLDALQAARVRMTRNMLPRVEK
jgi:hypothetical protein